MIWTIANREMRAMFSSPLAWSLLISTQVLLAWLFLSQLEQYTELQPQLVNKSYATGATELVVAPFLESVAVIFLLITPVLTMRSISEEFRSGTYNLLYSSPISLSSVVIGKYLAALAPMMLALLLALLMPLSLQLGTSLDMYRIAAAVIGLLLFISCISALGIFISSLTDQPAVAAMGSYGLLLFLWLVNLSDQSGQIAWIDWLSLASHYRRLLTGLVQTSDLLYYIVLSISFVSLTIYRLDNRRG